MAASLPDLVDCARQATDAAVIERVYALKELPRLRDLLARPDGELKVRFEFARASSGRPAATVTVHAVPQLVCQRCLKGFEYPVGGGSEVEFTDDEFVGEPGEGRELYRAEAGRVSLRELAEEELLLSLPIVAACSDPQTCPRATGSVALAPDPVLEPHESDSDDVRRPFLALREMLKKT